MDASIGISPGQSANTQDAQSVVQKAGKEMKVGDKVRVLSGIFAGEENVIVAVIPSPLEDRYDVEGTQGRWYYAHELELIDSKK
jgi:hypothetical protein